MIEIFGVKLRPILEKDIFAAISARAGKQIFIAKANGEFLLRARQNKEFRNLLNSADVIIPDGVGLLWAARYMCLPLTSVPVFRQIQALWQMIYTGASLVFYPSFCRWPLPESFPGQNCFYLMLAEAEKRGLRVYFFGAEEGVLKKSLALIKKRFPKLLVAGSHDGYSDKGKKVIDDINNSKAELLFVALGSPEQEFWIRDNLSKLKTVKAAVGEGGTHDFVAGISKRAPRLINRLGLEWLWRVFFSPNRTTDAGHRLARVWQGVPVLIFEVIRYKLDHGAICFE